MGTNDKLRAAYAADPSGTMDLVLRGLRYTVVPHDGGQRDVWEATDRFQVVCAGRRWGKSKIGVKKALRECRKPNKMVWWVAPTYRIVQRAYRETLKQLPPGVLAKPAPPPSAHGRLILQFKNGTLMEFYSAENPDAMVGEGVDYVVIDEAALIAERVWTQVIRPTLMDRNGRALMISTPRGENWFYHAWRRGQDPNYPEYRSWLFPTSSSPFIAPAEIEDYRKSMPAVIFEQEILAQFISRSAEILRITDSNTATGLATPKGHVMMGLDLAKHRDFTVISASNLLDRRPVFHDRFNDVSWPVQRKLIKEAVATIRDRGATHVTIMVDTGGPGDVVYDDLEEAGYDVVPINFTGWKNKAVQLLASDLDQNQAFVLPWQVEEFKNYAYTMTPAGNIRYEARAGYHDDEVSAKLLEHWGIVNGALPSVKIIADEEPEEDLPEIFTLEQISRGEILRNGFA